MSVARTAGWLAVGRLARGAAGLLVPVVLVRTLSVSDYGAFKQVDLVATLIVPFLVVGFDKSITYFVPRKEADPAEEITTPVLALALTSIAMLLFGALAPATFARLFGTVDLRLLAVAIAVSAGAAGLMQLGTRALLAAGAGRTAASLPVIVGVPRAIALVAAALVWRTLDAILVVCAIVAVVEAATLFGILIRHGCLRRPFFSRQVFGKHVRFGGTLGLVSMMTTWAGRIDRYLVSSSFGPAQFAIYAVGKTRVPFLRTLPLALGDASAPQFSRLDSAGRHREMGILWRKRAEALLPLYLLLAGFLASTAGWSIPIVFTDAYLDAVPVFRVFAVSLVVQAAGGLDLVLRALAALRFLLVSVVVSLVVRTLVCIALLPLGSLPLLAGVQIAATVVVYVVRLAYIRRRLAMPWSELLPRSGLLVASLSLVAGIAGTAIVAATIGDRRVPALAASSAIWLPLIVFTVWRQGLWRRLKRGGR